MVSPCLLRMEQTYAKIGLNIEPAQLKIKQPKAEIKMHYEQPLVELKITRPKVLIDQQPCWDQVGLKKPATLVFDYAAKGKEAALAAIGEISAEGTRLMRIEDGGNPIVEIAKEEACPPPDDYNIVFMPTNKPKITYVPGETSGELVKGDWTFQATPHKAEIEATRPQVETYLRQKNSLKIEYVGTTLDRKG